MPCQCSEDKGKDESKEEVKAEEKNDDEEDLVPSPEDSGAKQLKREDLLI